jgi:hypothetical protein
VSGARTHLIPECEGVKVEERPKITQNRLIWSGFGDILASNPHKITISADIKSDTNVMSLFSEFP